MFDNLTIDRDRGISTVKTIIVVIILIPILSIGIYTISGGIAEESNLENSENGLIVEGLVDEKLNITFAELKKMPSTTVNAELYCVSGAFVAEGDWTGVKLKYILDKAKVDPEAIKVAFYAKDDFTTDLPVKTAMRDDIIIAYERDGKELSENIRLVVPGKWGYKWIKKLARIELVDYDFKGFYEQRGYSDNAEISEK